MIEACGRVVRLAQELLGTPSRRRSSVARAARIREIVSLSDLRAEKNLSRRGSVRSGVRVS